MVEETDVAIAERVAAGADPAIVAAAIVAAVDDPSTSTCMLIGDDAIAAVQAFRQAEYEAWRAQALP
jgi:mannose-1-phosphate guanylyltransferase